LSSPTPRTRSDGPVARLRAAIFDTDGVVTRTATVHRAAWKRLFDDYLRERAAATQSSFVPFSDEDYARFVDGRPRYDGVESFLASRGVSLPRGMPADPPRSETVCGLGNTKNGYFVTQVREHGVAPFGSTLDLVRRMRDAGIRVAVVSASENCRLVLESAGAADLFEVRVDGVDAAELGLAGKPVPDLFLEAAQRLGVDPGDTAIVEDALAGVEAGRRGGFGLVVGVDREGMASSLVQHGADVVVSDLSELTVDATGRWKVLTDAGFDC
jgi:alpha,alpha-trehalase